MLLYSVTCFAQNTFPAMGNVGIGTLTPLYPLDVNGAARITGNLLVGGGVITTSTLNSTIKINAGDVDVINNLNVFGSINVATTSAASFGSLNATGNINTQDAFVFGLSNIGFKLLPPVSPGNGPMIRLGDVGGIQPFLPACWQADPNPAAIFPGRISSECNVGNPLNGYSASLRMFAAPWSGDSHIESQGATPTGGGNTSLYINYFCNKNILLGTGAGNCQIYTGDYVEMRKHLQIGTSGTHLTDGNNNAIDVFADQGKGVVVTTNNNGLESFKINNTSGTGGTTMLINGNGNAFFGLKRIQAGHIHANASYQFDGKVGCKELVVVDPSKWADFVFNKDYNLTPLVDVEKYYLKNKHLKDVPSEKEVKENGINAGDMFAIFLQKTEELTLYVVEQDKRIAKLEKEKEELKTLVKSLQNK